jgi:hypothetical protein
MKLKILTAGTSLAIETAYNVFAENNDVKFSQGRTATTGEGGVLYYTLFLWYDEKQPAKKPQQTATAQHMTQQSQAAEPRKQDMKPCPNCSVDIPKYYKYHPACGWQDTYPEAKK